METVVEVKDVRKQQEKRKNFICVLNQSGLTKVSRISSAQNREDFSAISVERSSTMKELLQNKSNTSIVIFPYIVFFPISI